MEKEIKKIVAETGKMLLEQRLVARTWGNISARMDEKSYVITPSGLDYIHMTEADIVSVSLLDGTWQGEHKPSGERGIHTAAYKVFPDVSFVIHTHQNFATAIGLAGFEQLDITESEKKELGGIAIADYGLPGTGKLTTNVEKMLETGAHVVMMAHHGVMICGKDRDETMKKVILLEKICERNMKGQKEDSEAKEYELPAQVIKIYPNVKLVQTPAVMKAARQHSITAKLNKYPAIMLYSKGIIVNAEDVSDREALEILVDKACICRLHTNHYGIKARLSWFDDTLMHLVYMKKYSKQKQS